MKLAVFFILAEDPSGTEVFNAVGTLVTTPMPEPSTIVLWILEVAMLPIVLARQRGGH